MTADDGRRLTVLYDAECGVCRLTILALLHLDWRHRLAAVALQAYRPAGPTRAELEAELHVRDTGGRWSRGGDATLRIAAEVPVLVPLAAVGRLPGMRGVVSAAYRFVAARRPAISRVLRLDAAAPGLRHRRSIGAGSTKGGH